MKRKLSFLTLLLIFCSTMFGQSHWTVNENTYNSTMNVTTYAEIYGELQNGASTASLEIAAFCGNEVRGVANIEYDPINLDYSAWMTIHGDTPNEIITFKLYDHSTNTEYTTDYTLRYRLNDVIGDDEQPITIDFVEYHWEFVKDNETMPYSMTIMSTASIDDILLNRRNFDIAAFYGDELRGVGRQQKDGIIYFAIWGDGTETEDITFKLYDHSDGTLYERTDYSVLFEINNILGDIANPVNINFTTKPYVAQIGDVKYISLAEAFEAAQNGDVVEILMAGTYELATSGKNITITGAVDGVVFDNIGAKNMGGANVTFNNVTFDYYPNVNYTGLQHSGNLVYNNCTINGQVFLYGTSETFSKCTFNQNSADAYNVWTYGAKDVDFIECTFNSVGKSVLIYNESESVTNDVTVTDCDFIATAPVDGKAAIEMDSSLQGEIELTVDAATTVTGFGTGNVSGNSLWNNKKGNETEANNDITVIVNGETVLAPLTLVAMTADDKNHRFTSLQAAYNNVAADGTITILNSVEGPGLVINKNVTIDFAGFTYTLNEGVGSTGTETNGLQILNGNTVVLKNGTLNVAESAKAKFYILVQNYANLTVDGMKLDGTNLDKYSGTDGDSYALSNNSGTVEIKGATEIIANNEGDKAFAFDVCKYANYAAPVVNVTGAEVKVNGAIEVHQDIPNNLNISAGTFTTEIAEAWCAEGYIPTQNTDGTWTVKAGKYVARIGEIGYETLAEAIAAIGAGDVVIELLDNASLDYNAREAYGTAETTSVTINGNGKTLTLNQINSDWSSFGLKNAGAKVVFNDMTIEKTGYGDTSGAWNTHAIIFTSNVEMTDVTVNNSMAVQAGATLNNVTINEANGYYGLWINGNGQSVTMNGGAINATNGGRGIKVADQYVDSPALVTLNVTGTKFNTAKKAAVLVSSKAGANITASNVDITNVAEDNVNFVWVDEDWGPYYGKVTVTGGTLTQENLPVFVAALMNNAKVEGYYKVFEEALAAAEDEKILVLKTVVFDTDKTIDFGGKEVNSNVNPAFRITNGATVTVKNGNMNTAEGYNFILGASDSSSAGNLTIESGKFHGATTVASVTKGLLTITGGEFSVEPYQGSYEFLINCIDANYNNGSATVSISGGTFHKWNPENNAAEGANTNFCAPGHVAVYDAVNDTYTVIEANYVAKIGEAKYISLQAAVDACVVGDNTIEMLAEINEDVTIKQVEGVNVVIEGAEKTFTGTFYIHGNARHDGAETLTFQNINFTTNEAGHYFIDSNSTASTERYAHNVTVKNCDFTATEAGVNSAAAMRIRQGFDIAINGGTFNDLHSVLQAYGNAGITVDGITVNGKNGISAGTSTGVVVKNTNITATGYGVRADGTGAYDVTIKGTTTINAAMPVVVRKTNDGNGYNLTIADGVTLTTTGSGYQVTFTAGDDGEYVAPTAGATANFGNNSYTTFGLVAKIENEYYTTVDYAAAYATTTEGTQTIVLIDDAAAATNPLNVEVIDLNGKTLTADVLGTVVTNGGLWTTAAAPGYKMLGVGAEIYATAGATVINSQTEVNIVEGDVTLVPAEWWTLQGQSLIIGEHASFTIPTGSKFNVMNNTDVTINGTAINNGTLAIHPEATVNGNVAGNLQFLGGSYVTAEDHKMVGTTDDYHYNTTDALVNIALNGDITIAAGTMTLGHDWRTLPNQTVTVASAAAFIVPSNMTYQIYGTAVVEDGGTLTVNGTIELASLTATLTAEDGLNVTLIDELQNQGYDVDYSNGTYSVIEGMIWNKTQDKKYNSLQAAIDASSEGDEIIVLKDIKYTQDDIITVDVYGYTTMVNATGKNVVLDLNGHLVEADVKDYSGTLLSIIFVGDDGSLTLKDSSVEKTGAVKAIGKEDQANVYALIIADTKNTTNIKLYIESGTYELNKCTDGGALVYVNISNILTVTGGNFYLGNAGTLTNNSPWIFNTHSNGINNVIVKGGNYNVSPIQHYGEVVIPVEFAVTQTSDVTYPYSVVPAVARIDQTGYASIADAVNEANDGDEIVVTVSHTATVPAVVERNLTLNMNGKAVTAQNIYPVVRIQKGASLTVTGAGSITNNDYVFVLGASDGTSVGNLTIENGTFHGATTVASVTMGSLNITGGEFSVEPYQGNYAFLINCYDPNYNNGAEVSISGGTFHKWNPENNAAEGANTNFCADGYVAVYDAVNDTYTVIEANYVAQIGEVKYESLQAAINAAQNGDEIDVIDNISLEIEDADQLCDNQYKSFFNVNGKTITIDLNGYTIKAVLGAELAANAVSALVSTENESNLTIKDSSDEKTGTMWIDNVIEVYSLVFQYDNSIVTIESGNYKLNVCGNGRGMVYSNDDEKVTVNGGNFWLGNVGALSNGSPWIFNASGQNTRNIIVNGGTFNDDVLHQFYPFEVKAPKEKALQNNGDGTWTMVDAVAYVDEQHRSGNWYTNNVGFTTLEEAFAAAQTYNQDGNYVTTVTMLANVTAIAPIVVESDVNFNLNGKTVTAVEDPAVYPVIRIQNGADVTIAGEGSIINNADYVFVLGASDGTSSVGNLTIENGTFHGATTVASVTKGLLTITGGDFSVEPYEGSYAFLINCIDANYEDGLATVSISGGTFHNWNPENNAAEGAGTNFCAQGYGAIENTPNVWTVIPKQTMTAVVKDGWNWFSYYVEGNVLDQLQNSLGAAGVQIKSRSQFTQYSNGNWNGDLVSTTPAESYKINVNADAVINVTGNIVNPSECPIMLNNGGTGNGAWNWIGYPLAQETSVATAFAGVVKNGDEVKTRTGFAEYVNGQWWGSLMTLKPGVGYMYFRAGANETVSNFTYPTPSSKEAVQPNITADANLWVPNSTSYANNMTMVAVLNMNGEMMNDNYEVAAMVDGEVRGSARPIYVEPMDAYMLFLTIHGEGVEEVTFQCYDFNTDTEYVLNNTINYSDDARLGSVNEPYVLCYGTMGIGENAMNTINIYPNPTTTGREINLGATCDKVEVYNALGVKVAEYQNVDTLDAIETAGIYVIRVTNDGDVKHCRLVVK